jgi:hypothetical protein
MENLKDRIGNAVGEVGHHMQQNVWQEAEYHFDVCTATNRAHIGLQYCTKRTLYVALFSGISLISVCVFVF